MVWCCDPFEPLSPEEEAQQSELVSTDEKKKKETEKEDAKEELDEDVLVSVTLPHGVSPGQMIEVRSPDGTRTVDTVVPEGLKAGQTFLVRFPASTKEDKEKSVSLPSKPLSLTERLDDLLTPKPDVPALKSQPAKRLTGKPVTETRQEAPTDEEPEKFDRLSIVRSLEDFLVPSSASQRSAPSQYQQQRPQPYEQSRGQQKLVEVQVPPGMPPGSTIFVEIPGENRTVAAQVPHNATSFHIAYTPQPRVMPPPQTRPVVVPHRQAPAGTKEKLLSVRVPPGTPPGTTLHVSVPDEPGRILAAKVPPGNVSKFHVSYVPSEQFQYKRSMLPPASAYHNRSRDKSHRAEPSASHASVHNAEQHVNSVVEDVAPVGSWTDKFGF